MTKTEVRRLHLLHVGWATVNVATHMPMEPERGQWYSAPVTAYLVEGRYRVLIDTGLAPIHLEDPQARAPAGEMTVQLQPGDLITNRLSDLGLSSQDIDLVVTTHLDFDHCGGHRFFPGRPIIVQKEHLEYAKTNPQRCVPDDWDHPQLHYETISGDHEIFPGLRLIHTPGHVPGHQSILVRLRESGTALLAGDAALTDVMFEEERVEGTADPSASLASIRRLKALRQREHAQIIIGHDADAWSSRYRVAPAAFYS